MKLLFRFVILCAVAAVLTFFYYKNSLPNPEISTVQAPGGTIHLEIADTEAARQQGLSGRPSLPGDRGLLFVFPQSGSYGFWMKNMHFSLDIVWIDGQKKIVGIAKNISPDTFPQTFTPPSPVRYALELNAGKSEQFGLKEGVLLGW